MTKQAPLWMQVETWWMSPGDAAYALGVTQRQLGGLVERGAPLTVHRSYGGQRRFVRAQVAALYWQRKSKQGAHA